MKRMLSYMIGTILIIGCTDCRRKATCSASYSEDSIREKTRIDSLMKVDPISAGMELSGTKLSKVEYVDSCLKDWPFPGANGNWIPSRDGVENCDTVVNGFPYNHI